jgi:hypothetical protein
MAVQAHTFHVAYCDRCRVSADEDGGECGATPEQALAVIERHGWLQIGTMLICNVCLDTDADPDRRVVLCPAGHESEHDGAWHALVDSTGDETYAWLVTDDDAACHCGARLAPSGADHRAFDEAAVPYLRHDLTWTYLRAGGCGTGKGSVLWPLLGRPDEP